MANILSLAESLQELTQQSEAPIRVDVNIRQDRKCFAKLNALAYYVKVRITSPKCFIRLYLGPNVIKVLRQLFTNVRNKLERLSPGKSFQPILMVRPETTREKGLKDASLG